MASPKVNNSKAAEALQDLPEDLLTPHLHHFIGYLCRLPLRQGLKNATQSLAAVFDDLDPHLWNDDVQSATYLAAAKIIHAYDQTPLLAPRDAPQSASLRPAAPPTTIEAVPAVASTYTPTPTELKQVCPSNLANHGPWGPASSIGCKLGGRCGARFHICKKYWYGIKTEGNNVACSHGADGVTHWDNKLNMVVIHLRPTCPFELPNSEGKVRGCRGSCSRAHPVDSGPEGYMTRLESYWRGGR